MKFEDLGEVMKLTYKADFIKAINKSPESIKSCFVNLKDNGLMTFDEAFDMVIRYIESRKMTITDKVIEDLFTYCYEVYEELPMNLTNYIELSKCYVSEDSDVDTIRELFTDEFIEKTDFYFNMMIASYYLNLLVERSDDVEEISRVNSLLKDQITVFKRKTGRE